MRVGQRTGRPTLFEGGGTEGAWGQELLFVSGLGVTGTGVREDRSGQTRKRGGGRDTWNADIPNRKMVRNHTLLASYPAGTVWTLIITLYIRSNFE